VAGAVDRDDSTDASTTEQPAAVRVQTAGAPAVAVVPAHHDPRWVIDTGLESKRCRIAVGSPASLRSRAAVVPSGEMTPGGIVAI